MTAGRPTEYNEAMLLKAQEYLSWANDTVDSNGTTQIRLPKAEGMALYIGIHRSTLYRWAEEHPEFSDILERMNQIQADRVIDKAMSGQYNSQIAKLLLGKHGYSDKQEIDHTSAGKAIPILGGLSKHVPDNDSSQETGTTKKKN